MTPGGMYNVITSRRDPSPLTWGFRQSCHLFGRERRRRPKESVAIWLSQQYCTTVIRYMYFAIDSALNAHKSAITIS